MLLQRTSIVSLLLCASLAAQWRQLATATAPSPRSGHGMTTDSIGSCLLFGGATPNPDNQTWLFDGVNWNQLTPALSPPGRFGAELVFDGGRGRYVLFGGHTSPLPTGPASNQTWEFDGLSWSLSTPSTSPSGRLHHGMCFDPVRNRVVLYGGVASPSAAVALADTWEFDGTTWTTIAGASQPGPLERPAMCFDAAANRTLLFGGTDPLSGGVDTLWQWTGSAWSVVPTAGARPPARSGAHLVHDVARGTSLLVGGLAPGTGAAYGDTWEWNGSGWILLPSTSTPGSDFGLAYDPTRRRTVRFGGSLGATTSNATWLHGAYEGPFGSGCPGSSGTPTLTALGAPNLGSNYSLVLGNLNLVAPFGVVVLGLNSTVPLPLATIGMPGCTGYVTPDLLVAVPSLAGNATWTGAIPAATGVVGVELFTQGLSLEPGINPAGLVNSNAHRGVVGL